METPEEKLMDRPPEHRLKWKKHIEYILSSIGYAVGLMNVWRFPYVCYKYGGASFLIPYTIMLILLGLPLYYMETIVGQFPSLSPVPAFGLVPCGKGVGISQVIIGYAIATYYVIIMVWATVYFYFGLSLNPLPWTDCNGEWGLDKSTCYVRLGKNDPPLVPPMCTSQVTTNCTHYESASVQFFNKYVLEKKDTTTFGNIGPVLPQLALLLILMWFIIFLCICKGIQTSGKVVYFTAVFPYFVLGYFCIVGFSLDGASDGLLYLIGDFNQITDLNVWHAAVTQMFLSCSIGLGGVVMYAGFNEFQNQLFRDSFIVVMVDFITSILAAIAVFSVIGFYSKYLDVPFEETFSSGISLIFLVMPSAVALMPWPKISILLFMLMIFTLGIDTQFVLVETCIVTIEDVWPATRRFRITIGMCVCTSAMLIGLVYVTRGGVLVFAMADRFVEITLTYSIFWEVIVVIYMYGINRFADDLFFMNGFRLNWILRICLMVIDPIVILVLFVVGLVNFEFLKEEDGFEPWANYVGLVLCLVIFLAVPIYAVYSIVVFHKQKNLIGAFMPAEDWGPAEPKYKTLHKEWMEDRVYYKNTFKQLYKKQTFPKVAPLKEIH